MTLAGRSDWPVLVSTKILDVGLMSGMAERAGGAVGISDGRKLLDEARRAGEVGPPSATLVLLADAKERIRPRPRCRFSNGSAR